MLPSDSELKNNYVPVEVMITFQHALVKTGVRNMIISPTSRILK